MADVTLKLSAKDIYEKEFEEGLEVSRLKKSMHFR